LVDDPAILADPVAAAEALVIANTSVAQPLVSEMNQWWEAASALGNSINNGETTKANSKEQTQKCQDAVNAAAGL
jgi:arabinogalactan oligomer/maltooligosaccharide transport system substrate-binding protein